MRVRSSKYVVLGLVMSMTAVVLSVDAGKDASSTTIAPAAPATSVPVVGGDPVAPFVACGGGRSAVMTSPYSSLAAAKAAFPNQSYVDLPAGDNSSVAGQKLAAKTTYFLEAGVHTLGGGEFSQIIPAKNDTFVGAPGAILDGQNQNAYAFTQHASGVTIEYLEVRHFVSPLDQGVVNHDAGAHWVMEHNYLHDNGGAALILGDDNTARYNCLDHNAQYGFQIFGDTVTASFNEVSHNDSANVESSNPGCGCSGGMKAWGAKNVVLDHNWVHDNQNVGLWVDTNNVGFDISHNQITDNTAEAIIYETSYNFHITNNYIARNDWVQGLANAGFPNPAIYISESGGDARAGSTYTTSEVANNTLVDNWGGVTLWENANRYCGGAGGDHDCTLVNPTVATRTTCSTTLLATTPYRRRLPLESPKRHRARQHHDPHPSEHPPLHHRQRLRRQRPHLPIRHLRWTLLPRRPLPRHLRRRQHHLPPEQPLHQQHLPRSLALRDPRTKQPRHLLHLENHPLQPRPQQHTVILVVSESPRSTRRDSWVESRVNSFVGPRPSVVRFSRGFSAR